MRLCCLLLRATAGRLREPHEGNFHQSPASHDALDFRGCEVPGSSRSSSDGNAGLVHIAAGFPLIRDLMPSRCCFPPVHSIAKLQCGSDTPTASPACSVEVNPVVEHKAFKTDNASCQLSPQNEVYPSPIL